VTNGKCDSKGSCIADIVLDGTPCATADTSCPQATACAAGKCVCPTASTSTPDAGHTTTDGGGTGGGGGGCSITTERPNFAALVELLGMLLVLFAVRARVRRA
jgi:hypothetical protein